MNDEPPSSLAEPQRLGITKKIRNKIKEIYQNFSYKPQNKQEIAGSIRDSSDRGVLEKRYFKYDGGSFEGFYCTSKRNHDT